MLKSSSLWRSGPFVVAFDISVSPNAENGIAGPPDHFEPLNCLLPSAVERVQRQKMERVRSRNAFYCQKSGEKARNSTPSIEILLRGCFLFSTSHFPLFRGDNTDNNNYK